MTDLEIIEGNRIVADFMGWHDEVLQSFTPPNDKHFFCSPINQERVVIEYPIMIDDLKYHTSWDWLMGVCEKLISEGVNVNIINRYCQIILFSADGNGAILYHKSNTMAHTAIENTWQAVVDFIRWHTSQPPIA